MPQFDVSLFPSQLFWLVIVFGVLYFVISRFIAPAAESILNSRHRVVDDHIKEAEEYNNQTTEIEALKIKELSDANKQAEALRAKTIKSLNSLFATKREEVSNEIKLKRSKAMAELQVYVDNFHAKESDPCMKLAAVIINKITGKEADMRLLSEIEKRLYVQNNKSAGGS